MSSAGPYDTLIIGGGHNGLVCATFLARGGRKVLVLEAAERLGGAAVTREFAPGFKVSSCAHLLHLMPPALMRELALEAQGLKIAAASLPTVALSPDARHLSLGPTDLSALQRVSPADAVALGDWQALMRRISRALHPVLAQTPPRLGLVSQPGVFSWDRPDPGSQLLAKHLGGVAGEGADLGCGVGLLALSVLASPKATALTLVDVDRRAIQAARRNIADPRARFLQTDLREPTPSLADLDFVVMNPPFHDGGEEDRGLGQAFIRRAAAMMRRGGVLRLVANIGLPYEATLAAAFDQARRLEQGGGYKVLEARRV